MITLDEARRYVLSGCRPLPPQALAIDDAIGCVLAEYIVATEPVPPFDNSAVDGFAYLASAVEGFPVSLMVADVVMAGGHRDRRVEPGQTVRVMTGAPLPDGTDTVCMLEHARADPSRSSVVIDLPLAAGANVRHAGDDVFPGDRVLSPGTVVGPAQVGVLASLGRERVRVYPRPRVGLLSTGDELHDGPGPLGPGRIRDSNRHLLLAQVAMAGGRPVDLGIVGDDLEAITTALSEAARDCDALVVSGGVSVGDRDLVKVALHRLAGAAMRTMQVAIKPAKPLAFGVLADSQVPAFGLPGNPVSALVSFELFARPGLRRLAGHRRINRPVVPATAAHHFLRRPDGKVHFRQVTAHRDTDGLVWASSVEGSHAHRLSAMTRANALAILRDGEGVREGEPVDLLLLDPAGVGGDQDESPSLGWDASLESAPVR
ncbi:MAG TPA: gephyrin-like molybdotransferase Glp [Acidimicrobiales bacterium]|jgi:molybdenum cofactor synthesis domain-containing protein|nr:gephyrin-like molybdotransferase Glp [Acidimicrobiales bacterium]